MTGGGTYSTGLVGPSKGSGLEDRGSSCERAEWPTEAVASVSFRGDSLIGLGIM